MSHRVLRRSSRARKPPKDPFADDFVGDSWKKMRSSSNVHDLPIEGGSEGKKDTVSNSNVKKKKGMDWEKAHRSVIRILELTKEKGENNAERLKYQNLLTVIEKKTPRRPLTEDPGSTTLRKERPNSSSLDSKCGADEVHVGPSKSEKFLVEVLPANDDVILHADSGIQQVMYDNFVSVPISNVDLKDSLDEPAVSFVGPKVYLDKIEAFSGLAISRDGNDPSPSHVNDYCNSHSTIEGECQSQIKTNDKDDVQGSIHVPSDASVKENTRSNKVVGPQIKKSDLHLANNTQDVSCFSPYNPFPSSDHAFYGTMACFDVNKSLKVNSDAGVEFLSPVHVCKVQPSLSEEDDNGGVHAPTHAMVIGGGIPSNPNGTPKKLFSQLFQPLHDCSTSAGAPPTSLSQGTSKDEIPIGLDDKPSSYAGLATMRRHDKIPDINSATSTLDFPLDFVPHGKRSENLILQVPKVLIEEGSNEWGTTLVGYFIGKGLPYSLVTSATERLWEDYGLFDTLATDSGIFFFTFPSESQRDAVLEGGPWYIAGQPLILQPWKPSLRLDKKDVQSIPIWVNLYGIPLELWNPKGISFIASYIGKPLRVDRMTASRRRITYARVCVEVSGELDLIDKFAIETVDGDGKTTLIDIAVEYQWLPIRCSKCSTFGHDCDKVASQKPRYGVHRANLAQSYHPTPRFNHHNTAKEGVWQVVQRKDKGKKIVEGAELEGSARVSPQRLEATDRVRRSDIDASVACSSEQEHVIFSINNLPSICENRTSTVPIDNSFNGLIPYVYDREDNGPLDVCVESSLNEGSHEEDDTNEKIPETAVANAIDTPISGRQKKKEAKMLFSGSRPKGRHRS